MIAQNQSSIAETLKRITAMLRPVAAEEAAQQSRLLLCHVLGFSDASTLVKNMLQLFPQDRTDALDQALARRLAGEPLQYILGEWDFMGLTFQVRPGVLIPRQDTETLCEHALELIRLNAYNSALDMCCGSGCIGISLAALCGISITLADISLECISLAEQNAKSHGLNAALVQSDLFDSIHGTFDLIVCNPPYIPAHDMPSLQREVRHEPALALCGGTDGLNIYRRLAAVYALHLNAGGALLMEVGINQAPDVIAIFGKGHTICDINGIERVVVVA
ncbi:MAG: peptide chain release factor N(5)-glutamine methyltransferase [Clostridia bacterium]